MSLGSILAELLKTNGETPSIVSCTTSVEETEKIVAEFACAVRPGVVAGRRGRILPPAQLQQLTFR